MNMSEAEKLEVVDLEKAAKRETIDAIKQAIREILGEEQHNRP